MAAKCQLWCAPQKSSDTKIRIVSEDGDSDTEVPCDRPFDSTADTCALSKRSADFEVPGFDSHEFLPIESRSPSSGSQCEHRNSQERDHGMSSLSADTTFVPVSGEGDVGCEADVTQCNVAPRKTGCDSASSLGSPIPRPKLVATSSGQDRFSMPVRRGTTPRPTSSPRCTPSKVPARSPRGTPSKTCALWHLDRPVATPTSAGPHRTSKDRPVPPFAGEHERKGPDLCGDGPRMANNCRESKAAASEDLSPKVLQVPLHDLDRYVQEAIGRASEGIEVRLGASIESLVAQCEFQCRSEFQATIDSLRSELELGVAKGAAVTKSISENLGRELRAELGHQVCQIADVSRRIDDLVESQAAGFANLQDVLARDRFEHVAEVQASLETLDKTLRSDMATMSYEQSEEHVSLQTALAQQKGEHTRALESSLEDLADELRNEIAKVVADVDASRVVMQSAIFELTSGFESPMAAAACRLEGQVGPFFTPASRQVQSSVLLGIPAKSCPSVSHQSGHS